MNHLDLFSGIGGFALGLQRAGFTTVAFCEIESYCQRVLAKHWPDIPIYEDIHHVTADRLAADGLVDIDIITGGYPCQPFSHAGQRGGAEDDRHLWPQIARLVRELVAAGRQPAWLLFENVAGHISLGLDTVLADLDAIGYAGWPLVVPAGAVGARHRRDRVWIIGHYRCERGQGRATQAVCGQSRIPWSEDGREFTDQFGLSDLHTPRLCGTDDGIPNRVDRLRGLGNAVVPQIPEIIGRAIMEASK